MPAYTNLGIEQIDNGTQAGTWGTTTNNNFEYFDTAIVGVLEFAISTAANTDLNVANYAPSSPDGRNRILVFSSATNLGAVCNVRITKNSSTGAPFFEGYYFVRNSLNTSDLIIYQGATIPGAANYARIPNGQDAIVVCFGDGTVGLFLRSQQFTTISGPSGQGLPINSAAASGPALSTTVPAKLTVGPGTYTDNVTAASTTVAFGTLNSLRTSAIAASNSSVTYTRAATLYVENAPSAGSNVTITTPYAIYSANGTNYFGGRLGISNTAPVCAADVVGGIKTSRVTVTAPATTDGNIFSGSYAAAQVSTNVNVASVTFGTNYYMRVGNMVTVIGQVAIDATAINIDTTLRMSLPIASNFSTSRQLGGSGNSVTATLFGTISAAILGDTTNNCAEFRLRPTSASSISYQFSFTYNVA